MSEFKGTPALDAGLIAAAQAVEHYEITRYGTLKRWAEVLGMPMRSRCSTPRFRRKPPPTRPLTSLADAAANQEAAEGAEDAGDPTKMKGRSGQAESLGVATAPEQRSFGDPRRGWP